MIHRSKLEETVIAVINQHSTENVCLDSRLREDLYIGEETKNQIDAELEAVYVNDGIVLYDLGKWNTVRDVVNELEYRLMDAGYIVFDGYCWKKREP